MANVYQCKQCGAVLDGPMCGGCNTASVKVVGDLHLAALGVDAYISLNGDRLIIKKASGQVAVQLQERDLTA